MISLPTIIISLCVLLVGRSPANIFVELASSDFVAITTGDGGGIKNIEELRNLRKIDAKKTLKRVQPNLHKEFFNKKKSSVAISIFGRDGLDNATYWVIDGVIHCEELGEVKITDIRNFVANLDKKK